MNPIKRAALAATLAASFAAPQYANAEERWYEKFTNVFSHTPAAVKTVPTSVPVRPRPTVVAAPVVAPVATPVAQAVPVQTQAVATPAASALAKRKPISLTKRAKGDDCPDCPKKDYIVPVPADQYIGPVTIERHLESAAKNGRLRVETYDRHAFERNRASLDTFCKDSDYIQFKLPALTERQKKLGMTLEYGSYGNDTLKEIMSDRKVTSAELKSLQANGAGYRVLKTMNFIKLLDKDGKTCASYEFPWNGVLHDKCDLTCGTPACDEPAPEASAQTTPDTTGTPDGTPDGTHNKKKGKRKPVRVAGPSETDITALYGTGMDNFSAKSSDGVAVPSYGYDLSQVKVQIRHRTDNTELSARAAFTTGSDAGIGSPSSYCWSEGIQAKSVQLNGDFRLAKNWTVSPTLGGAVEYKEIKTGNNVVGEDSSTNYVTPELRAGLTAGRFNGSHVEVAAVASLHNLTEKYASATDLYTASGATELGYGGFLKFRWIMDENKKFELEGEARYEMMKSLFTSGERQIEKRSDFWNTQLNAIYNIGDHFSLVGQYKFATDRNTFAPVNGLKLSTLDETQMGNTFAFGARVKF